MSSGANELSPQTDGKVIEWSRPITTGKAPFPTIFATACDSLSKFRIASDGTTMTLPQSAMVPLLRSSSAVSLSK